ncbi:MAG: hypothetical protein KJ583_06310 [Nanoarchaeota archaeon]|nr:hypothetical protein [Nanoarchaeota archaeon]MBU1269366.1 hypothetical protein [Nanoarchaeota archaeon]MBU1604899.1 hypothetical protein [Nanoarchaeota archaeon]MBU2442680.1 hypothetical protein [Nanoarchaeota archaeon]
MPKTLTLDEAYENCNSQGMFLPQQEVGIPRAKTMLLIAEEDLKTIQDIKEKKNRINTLYKLTYDVIHTLAEAFLLIDKVKSQNHQCLFAYLCYKHPELEFNWNFFETIRTKRNGIHYYGKGVIQDDWKEVSLQADIYIKLLIRKLKEQLSF